MSLPVDPSGLKAASPIAGLLFTQVGVATQPLLDLAKPASVGWLSQSAALTNGPAQLPQADLPEFHTQSNYQVNSMSTSGRSILPDVRGYFRHVSDFFKNFRVIIPVGAGGTNLNMPMAFFSSDQNFGGGSGVVEADAYMRRANYSRERNDIPAAITKFSAAAEIYLRERYNLQAAEALFNLGCMQAVAGSAAEADASFDRSIRAAKDYISGLLDGDEIAPKKLIAAAYKRRGHNIIFVKPTEAEGVRGRIASSGEYFFKAYLEYNNLDSLSLSGDALECGLLAGEAKYAVGNRNGSAENCYEGLFANFVRSSRGVEGVYVKLRMVQYALARGDTSRAATLLDSANVLLKRVVPQVSKKGDHAVQLKRSLLMLGATIDSAAKASGAYQPDYDPIDESKLDLMVKIEESTMASGGYLDRNTLYEGAARDAESRAQFVEAFTYRLRAIQLLLIDGDLAKASEKIAIAVRAIRAPQAMVSAKNIDYSQLQFVVAARRISEQSILAGAEPTEFGLVNLSGVSFNPQHSRMTFSHLSVRGVLFVLRRHAEGFATLSAIDQAARVKEVLRSFNAKYPDRSNLPRVTADMIISAYKELGNS